MMTFSDSRRGYDDRYDVADYARYPFASEPRRPYEPRWERHSRRYASGDWMREMPWTRESAWLRNEGPWTRESGWLRNEGPWTRDSAWLRSEGPWTRDSAWLRNEGPWTRDSAWHRDSWNASREAHPYAELEGMTSIEISAQSPHSWEDATRRAIADASRTVRGIRHLCVEDLHTVLDEEIGMLFRVHARVWFDDNRRRR